MNKTEKRAKRRVRIRAKISGTESRPRLAVFRSNRQIYAQIIDDSKGVTLVSADSLKLDGKTPREKAEKVAEELAKKAGSKGISSVIFDRGGFLYAGNLRLFAETARKAGLTF